jgi:hypothetical protein
LAVADDDVVVVVPVAELGEGRVREGAVPGFLDHLDGNAGLLLIEDAQFGQGVGRAPFGPEDLDFRGAWAGSAVGEGKGREAQSQGSAGKAKWAQAAKAAEYRKGSGYGFGGGFGHEEVQNITR